ncbi:MAG: CPBP family intramembrane metalloprotease [Butyrivibrio sp.]|nr:CPBP family intramembrane metalloprotease [Butyrivibrio sp.]
MPGSFDKENQKPLRPYSYLLFALLGGALALCLTYIFNITGLTEMESYKEVADAQFFGGLSMPVMILTYCLLTPFCEELIFRRFLMNFLEKNLDIRICIVLSAALFGIYHWNLVQGLYAFIMGLLMAFMYARYKRLSVPFTIHAAANAAALAFTFLL